MFQLCADEFRRAEDPPQGRSGAAATPRWRMHANQAVDRSPVGDPPSFRVHVDLTTGRLTAAGRLERRTTHLLADAVRTLLVAEHRAWHLDVDGVTAIDTEGVRAVVAAYRLALRHDRRLTLHGPDPALREALGRLRLDRHLLAPHAMADPAA
ncbi:MAG: STAS domain-containing protein [Kineosporiaceae bacterium]